MLIHKWGAFLVDLFRLNQPGKGNARLIGELISLSAGKRTAVRNFYIQKVIVVTVILAAGLLLSLLSFLFYGRGNTEEIRVLDRPGYGEGDRKEELTVQIEGQSEEQILEITVQERKYTDEERNQLFETAIQELEAVLPGANESLDRVQSPLVFPQSLADGRVTVSWMTIPYGVIGDEGQLLEVSDENGTLVEIQGTLTCAGEEQIHSVYIKVFPPELTEQEMLYQSIRQEVELADANESHTDSINLPQEVEGRRLIWSGMSDNPYMILLIITFLIGICVYLQMDSEIHKKAEIRRNQLLLDYPDFMWKMTMLLGAGLSIKGAFTRISGEYLRKNKEPEYPGSKKVCYLYEEITYTCFEMQSGIPEAQAYERFGKRCQLPEYIRIGTVLSQNLKKGAKGLTTLLETEAETSLTERKNQARKIGERAGTKLLLPMVLMLGVVLAILMVPAFLSF